jgi:isopenicillin N synthase-like dioxygenase
MNIPTLDLDLFIKGNVIEKKQFSHDIGEAFHNIGFVSIKNHGIDDQLVQSLYESIQRFFSLPLELKQSYEINGLAGQRGYTSFGKEHAKGSVSPDLKEFFQFGQPMDEHLPNVLVNEISDLNTTLDKAFIEFEKSGLFLLRAIAIYLGLDEYYFDKKVIKGESILRAIHYPPITQNPQSAVRAEQHEDINLITLLIGASADGLQILSKENKWLNINADPGHIVVNVGDMLQRLTNNKLKSTTHRVINPPEQFWHTSRFSIPFFLHPHSSVSLSCLESCITADTPRMFNDITAGEYLHERLIEIGLKN